MNKFETPTYYEVVESRKIQFKDEIILKACKVFIHRGYEKTTMGDLAQEFGLSRPNLYYYFKSKKDILQMIIDYTTAAENQNATELDEKIKGLKPADALTLYIRDKLNHVNDYQDLYVFRIQVATILEGKDRQKLYDSYDIYIGEIESILEKGIAAGEFKTASKKLASFSISYLLTAWAIRRWYLRRHFSLDEYVRWVAESSLALLGAGSILGKPVE